MSRATQNKLRPRDCVIPACNRNFCFMAPKVRAVSSPRTEATRLLGKVASLIENNGHWPADAVKTRLIEQALTAVVMSMPATSAEEDEGSTNLAVSLEGLTGVLEQTNKQLRAYQEVLTKALPELAKAAETGSSDGVVYRRAHAVYQYFALKAQWEGLSALLLEKNQASNAREEKKAAYSASASDEERADAKKEWLAAKAHADGAARKYEAAVAALDAAHLEVEACKGGAPFPCTFPEAEAAAAAGNDSPADGGPRPSAETEAYDAAMATNATAAAAPAAAATGHAAAEAAAAAKATAAIEAAAGAKRQRTKEAVEAFASALSALKEMADDLVDLELGEDGGEAAVKQAMTELAKLVNALLGESLGHDEDSLTKLADPASVEQLKTYMEKRPGGFSWAAVVNGWSS